MKLDKYWTLTLISLLLSLLIGMAAYFTTFLFSKQVFLKISRENVANYLEVTAVAAGSKKRLDELREVLKRSPYVEEVFLEGPRAEDPFTLDKTLIFPDGTAAVSIRLDKELVEERASALARSVGLIVFSINLVFQLFFLLILRLLY
ncbi:MAG: diguanylate cyclase, partial [Desulfurobacteriaceae bacterium]